MPPKPKFTREEVLEAALGIVRSEGEAALTARRLGQALGSSPRPIFTLFDSMDEVKEGIVDLAWDVYSTYLDDYRDYVPAFKRFGVCLVAFAGQEPNLFTFLVMSKHGDDRSLADWATSSVSDDAIETLKGETGLDDATARILFQQIWLHTFSLCVLKATDVATLTEEEISASLTYSFLGLYSLAKAGMLSDTVGMPQKKAEAVEVTIPPAVPISRI